MVKNKDKLNTLIKISKILSAVCAIFSLVLIILNFAANDGNALLSMFAFIFPIISSVLIYLKKPVLVLTGGIISGCVGLFTLINQAVAIFTAENKTSPWIFCITLTFTFCLLASGILSLIWCKHNKDNPRRRFQRT